MKLIKGSMPGWTKEFDDEAELKQYLYHQICGVCRDGEKVTDDNGNIIYESDPVGPDDSINDMLATACGLEFYVEE